MVTVVRNTNSSQMLGQAAGQGLGQGIAKGAGQELDFQQQRRQMNRALKPLEALMSDPSSTADQRAMAMLKASTVVPAAASLIPYYMGQSASKSGAAAMTGPGGRQISPPAQSSAGPQRSMGSMGSMVPMSPSGDSPTSGGSPSSGAVDNRAEAKASTTPTSDGDRPYFTTTASTAAPGIEEYLPNQYSAEEALQLYNKDRMENPMAAEANAAARTAFNAESIRQTNNLKEAQQATLGKYNNISTWLDTDFPNEFKNNNQLKAKAIKEIEGDWTKEPLSKTHDKIDKWLKPIRESIETFKASAVHPFSKRDENQKEILRRSYNRLKDSGLEGVARLALANGTGNGEVEDAEIRDPLSKRSEQLLKNIGSFKKGVGISDIPMPAGLVGSVPGILKRAAGAISDIVGDTVDANESGRSKQINLYKDLSEVIKENANLMILRRRLKDHGLDWRNAGHSITKAIDIANNDGYKLSQQQNTDLSKLSYEPLGGENWFKRMMNYIFFEAE